MKPTIIKPRLSGMLAGLSIGFDGDPLDWLEANVRFPHSARSTQFLRTQGPWWNQIIKDYTDPHIRQITIQACTGAGKSTLLEALSCWIIAQDPGPTLSITQTDQTAREWLETRLVPVLDGCAPVAAVMPANRHAKRKDAIVFGHMPFLAGGANVSNAQEKSVRHLFLDEAWTYSDLVGQFKARHHDRYDRKTLIVTQSWESPHSLDDEWRSGQRHYWGHECIGCGELLQPDFRNIKYDECKTPEGEWAWGALAESVRHECPHCNHVTLDTAQGRRAIADRSRWVVEEGDFMPGHRSYHIPAQSVWWIKWSDLVAAWVRAQDAKNLGLLEPLKDFRLKRLAQPWSDVAEMPKIELEPAEYNASEYGDGKKIDDEVDRMMTIDVQQDHFWSIVRAWSKSGTSKLLFTGKVLTEAALRETQIKYKIADKKVFMDAGNSFHGTVYDRCAKYGWTALIGRGQDYFQIREQSGRVYKRLYSMPDKVLAPTTRAVNGKRAWVLFFYWASDPIKDILSRLRAIGSPTWEFPQDVPEEYRRHLNSEIKRDVVDKMTKRTRKRWTFVGRPNHLWDCEAMQVTAALLLKILPDVTEAEVEVDKVKDVE